MRYFFLFLFIASATVSFGQTEEIVTVKTKDRQVFVGNLKKLTADSIIIENEIVGILRLSRDSVTFFSKGDSSFDVLNNSEPYFVSTAIPNGRNNHHYRNYAVFGQDFSFGISDNLDLSFGLELYTLIFDEGNDLPLMKVGLKYSGEISKNVYLGFSSKILFNDEGGVVLLNLPFTAGGGRTNFTISPGYGRSIDSFGESVFTILSNFNISLSDQLRLVTDVFYIDEVFAGTSLIEIKLKNNILFMPGIIFGTDLSILPNLSFTIPFGKKNK